MEHIIFGVIGLLSRLTTSWSNLIASVRQFFARQFSRLSRQVEPAIAVILWSVPLAFWTIVFRFVVKHH
jgi:hypothetical protein